MKFEPTELTAEESKLQREVRQFLDELLPPGSYEPGLGMAAGSSKALSLALGERGLLGMALPAEYGGGNRSAVERFVVVEELLRRGAPVGHHWTADRQSGPVISRFGTEAQKRRFLPPICRGELSFAIGMSEPDAGSDLAGVKSRAVRVDGGWELSGTKVWTSNAHQADYAITLCRTSDTDDRHEGLSQLLVDLRSPGVTVSPIRFLDGTSDFCEVVLDSVFVPGELLLGVEGQGWQQNTSELSFERAGPERWMSPYLVVEHFLRQHGAAMGEEAESFLGDVLARWWGIRQVSLAVARMIDEGRSPSVHSAMGKDLGTQFEQEVMARIQTLVEAEPSLDALTLFERLLARALLVAPSWSIRGGTNEILRTVIAKGLR
ncbi:MAG TPA: acyl-CoA dehydrogenase family protein [Acidimicrobiales bacterium]|nr:acyl-CoA dehydrogenase family protein [Acidimicrobiales bacterium]